MRTIVVVGAGAANLKSTVAANLAAAVAMLDVAVALHDRDGASTRALSQTATPGRRVQLPWAAGSIVLGPAQGAHSGVPLAIVDPPPRLDEVTRADVAAADLVLVPVDASPLARRALREVRVLLDQSGHLDRLRVALSRVVPRTADRWALVDDIEGDAPGALLHATLPMVRARRGSLAGRDVTLYAPGTAAAHAYERLARELLAVVGLAPALSIS
jgi:cellulose biosynthesis protein BcsQ